MTVRGGITRSIRVRWRQHNQREAELEVSGYTSQCTAVVLTIAEIFCLLPRGEAKLITPKQLKTVLLSMTALVAEPEAQVSRPLFRHRLDTRRYQPEFIRVFVKTSNQLSFRKMYILHSNVGHHL